MNVRLAIKEAFVHLRFIDNANECLEEIKSPILHQVNCILINHVIKDNELR